ncbi:MAG: C40 family peptidase [Burkholderiaceae bacterium]|jgi:cell wall-associated NlpC family hydrolase|nr:C40 family peptidase [Burkholderiaceae bacterium]
MFRFKPFFATVFGLVLGVSVAMAHAEPMTRAEPLVSDNTQQQPSDADLASQPDGTNLTERSLTAVGQAASKIGNVLNTGAQAFGSGVHRVTDQASTLIAHAKESIGVRYQWGGASAQTGFDCSGFVRAMVEKTVGKLLPHHAAAQAAVTQTISKNDLRPGDLVFFDTVRRRAYSHVGIYMGDGQFIHAPARGQSVRIDNLSEAYWQKRFEGARRVLTGDISSSDLTNAAAQGLTVSKAAASLGVFPGIATTDTATDDVADRAAAASAHRAPDAVIADAGSSTDAPATGTSYAPTATATAATGSVLHAPVTATPKRDRALSRARKHSRRTTIKHERHIRKLGHHSSRRPHAVRHKVKSKR